MNRVNVDYKNKQAVSDIFTLTNVVTNESVALIPSDSAGNFSWTGITKAPIVRNAMQTSTTSGEWSDLEYPYMAIPQEDWTGGRANLRFSTDKSRFFDSKRAQTAYNACIYNAPLEYYSDGLGRSPATNCPGSLYWENVFGANKYIATRFKPSGDGTKVNEVYIHLRRRGIPRAGLVVELADGLGANANILASHTYTTEEITDTLAEFRKFTFDQITLDTTKYYYIIVHSDANDSANYWSVGCFMNRQSSTSVSTTNNGYQAVNFEMYYRVSRVQDGCNSRFFIYKQLLFAVRGIENGENNRSDLIMNGEIGKVASATTHTITDSSKSWTENQWAGARIGLVYRDGSQEHVNCWRTIESNTSDTITVDNSFVITPAADCVYIINDTPLWQTISGHGLTGHVTDVHVIRDTVYLAQGDYTDVIKMRWHDGAFQFKGLTGCKATYLQSVRDTSAMMLYRGRNDGINHERTIERSILLDWADPISFTTPENAITTDGGVVYGESVDFGSPDYDCKQYVFDVETVTSTKNDANLYITLQESEDNSAFHDVQTISITSAGKWYLFAHCQYQYRRLKYYITGQDGSASNISCSTSEIPHWGDPIVLLDNYGKITRLFEYGAEQEKSLWVFQEGMVSSVNKTGTNNATYHLDRINLDELQVTADQWNSKAVGTSDVYLLFSWLNGLQRYYNTQLEGKGPDHDEGMPTDMKGRITQFVSYPGSFFVSIDAGENGYSSVMLFNGSGWHNIYRAPNKGERIFDIAFQPIYGDRPDRLWINVGDDIIWLAMPSKILYAIQDPNAEYTHESVVVSAWITGGMAEVDKLWQSMSIMADNLDGKTCWIEADYQLDDEEQWHPLPMAYTESPGQEIDFADTNESINGKKLRYRLRLQSTDMNKTPKVNVVLVKAIGRVDIKYSYGFHFRNIKYKADLTGEYEDVEPYELDLILSEWANELATLRLNSAYKLFDNKRVFLDGVTTNVVYEKGEGYLSQITLTEI